MSLQFIRTNHKEVIHTEEQRNPDGVREMVLCKSKLLSLFQDSKIRTYLVNQPDTIPLSIFVSFLDTVEDNDTRGKYVQYIDFQRAAGYLDIDELGCPTPRDRKKKIRFATRMLWAMVNRIRRHPLFQQYLDKVLPTFEEESHKRYWDAMWKELGLSLEIQESSGTHHKGSTNDTYKKRLSQMDGRFPMFFHQDGFKKNGAEPNPEYLDQFCRKELILTLEDALLVSSPAFRTTYANHMYKQLSKQDQRTIKGRVGTWIKKRTTNGKSMFDNILDLKEKDAIARQNGKEPQINLDDLCDLMRINDEKDCQELYQHAKESFGVTDTLSWRQLLLLFQTVDLSDGIKTTIMYYLTSVEYIYSELTNRIVAHQTKCQEAFRQNNQIIFDTVTKEIEKKWEKRLSNQHTKNKEHTHQLSLEKKKINKKCRELADIQKAMDKSIRAFDDLKTQFQQLESSKYLKRNTRLEIIRDLGVTETSIDCCRTMIDSALERSDSKPEFQLDFQKVAGKSIIRSLPEFPIVYSNRNFKGLHKGNIIGTLKALNIPKTNHIFIAVREFFTPYSSEAFSADRVPFIELVERDRDRETQPNKETLETNIPVSDINSDSSDSDSSDSDSSDSDSSDSDSDGDAEADSNTMNSLLSLTSLHSSILHANR